MSAVKDSMGRTVLHLSAENNDLKKLEELLKSGECDVNEQDVRGRSVLHCLLMKDSFSDLKDITMGIQMLLEYGADVNIKDKHKDTPLHVVCYGYDLFAPEIIKFLLQCADSPPFDMEQQNSVGYTVFYNFMYGYRENIREDDDFDELIHETELFINEYLEKKIENTCPADTLLNKKDINGYSAFQMYVSNQDYKLDTLKSMISCGADVNTKSFIGITPLMDTVTNRDHAIVHCLLQAGADPNIKDIFGQTALFRVQTTACFELLCEYGADLSVKDKFGRIAIAEMLLYTPEDLPRSDISYSTDISTCQPLVELFLEHGLNCNDTDRYGSTLLHYAAYHGNDTMISTLLQNGVDPQKVDYNGITPFELARGVGNFDVLKLLDSKEENEPEKPDSLDKYLPITIHKDEVADMNRVLNEHLHLSDDPRDLITRLISSPRIGLTSRQLESAELKSDIIHLMHKLASFVSSADPVFRCSVVPTGSSSDGTKIGDPDEFDFMFCLEYFSEECIPYQSQDMINSGFASLKLKSFYDSHPLTKYVTDGYFVESFSVRDTFQELVTMAFNNSEFWKSENMDNFSFDGIIRFPTDKPILNLHIEWFGRILKHIVICLDIVPAVSIPHWIPAEMSSMDMTIRHQTVRQDRFFLLFQPPEDFGEFRRTYVRISCSLHELHELQNLPTAYLESYAVSKILVSEYFCPKLQFDEEFDFDSVFDTLNESTEDTKQESESLSEDTEAHSSLPFQDVTEDETEDIECQKETGVIVLGGSEGPDMIQGMTLIRNGSKYEDMSTWIIEIDETMTVRKLFTPKDDVIDMADESIALNDKEFIAKKTYNTMKVQKDRSTWICFWPSRNGCPLNRNCHGMDLIKSKMKVVDDLLVTVLKSKDNDQCVSDNARSYNDESGCCSVEERHSYGTEFIISASTPEQQKCENVETASGMVNVTADQTETDISSTEENASDDNNAKKSTSKQSIIEDTNDVQWEGGIIVYVSEEISSYMLKNCLMYVASESKNSHGQGHLDITIKIFEKLQESAKAGRLNSYFLPFLEIFSFANSHIRLIPEEDLEETTRSQCERIELFCEVILGILRQNQSDKMNQD